jgi:hypothetical protein
MNWTHNRQRRKAPAPATNRAGALTTREAVARLKQRFHEEFKELVGEHLHLLRLALNEAEALAWQTDFPQLFFPALAAEKAQAAVTWHRRQRKVCGPAIEWAFAE